MIEVQEAMFLTIKTSKGIFQFAVYNSHNGYYGHDGVLMKQDNKVENFYLAEAPAPFRPLFNSGCSWWVYARGNDGKHQSCSR